MSDLNRPGYRPVPRDEAILTEIALSNVVTAENLVSLGPFTGISRARRRVALLESRGLVRRSYLADGSPSARSVFSIGPAAVDLVAERTGLDRAELARKARRPFSRMFVEHGLAVTEVRVALTTVGSPGEVGFSHEQLVRHEYDVARPGGKAERHVFKPDGLFRVGSPTPAAAFLELDRGSASHAKVAASFAGYSRYVRLGLFAGEYGVARPVVLFVTTAGPRRIRQLSPLARKSGVPPVLFATLEAVTAGGADGRFWTREPGGDPVSFADLLRAGGFPC